MIFLLTVRLVLYHIVFTFILVNFCLCRYFRLIRLIFYSFYAFLDCKLFILYWDCLLCANLPKSLSFCCRLRSLLHLFIVRLFIHSFLTFMSLLATILTTFLHIISLSSTIFLAFLQILPQYWTFFDTQQLNFYFDLINSLIFQ